MKIVETIFNRYKLPKSIEVKQEDIHKNLNTSEGVMKKILEIMDEVNLAFKEWKHNALAEILFMIIILIGVVTNNFVLTMPSLLIYLWLHSRGVKIDLGTKQRMGFIDGILYTLNDIANVVEKARNDPRAVEKMDEYQKKMNENLVDKKI